MNLLSFVNELRVRAFADARDLAHVADDPIWSRLLEDLGQAGAGARPIVIQGGLSTDAYLYEPLKRMLQSRGFDVTATHLENHGYASLQRDATSLKGMVEAASERSKAAGGDGLVTVIAHSKGGLAARWYLQRMDGLERLAQVITIGTPHNGSRVLGRMSGTAGAATGIEGVRQLMYNSPEVRGLNGDLRTTMEYALHDRPDFRIVSVTGDMGLPVVPAGDGLVTVAEAHLDESIPGLSNVVFTGLGAHHGAVAGQFGMFEPTLRAMTMLGAGSSVHDAARGASYASFGSL